MELVEDLFEVSTDTEEIMGLKRGIQIKKLQTEEESAKETENIDWKIGRTAKRCPGAKWRWGDQLHQQKLIRQIRQGLRNNDPVC